MLVADDACFDLEDQFGTLFLAENNRRRELGFPMLRDEELRARFIDASTDAAEVDA